MILKTEDEDEEAASRPTSFHWFFGLREGARIVLASGGGKVGNLFLVARWFNTNCFSDPAFGTWGNAAFGVITEPGIHNWNMATAKRFRIRYAEGHAIEFRGDYFNAFNHTQWLAVDKNLRSASYGRVNAVRPPRQIQLLVRYIF